MKVYYFNENFDGKKWWFHEVGKIPSQKWEIELREGFPNEVIGTDQMGFPRSYRKLEEILLQHRPSAIIVYGYYLPEHWALRWLCGRMDIPLLFIGETFTQSASLARKLIKIPLLRYYFSGVGQFIAIGEKTRDFYHSLRVPDTRIVGAKYCTDVSFFTLPPAEATATRMRWRKAMNIPENAFVLLFVGRLFERKRPEDMIALHKRLKSHPGVYTVLVGNGPLETSLRAQGLGDDRLIFAGFRNQGQTRESYYGSDILVVPSEYETWGLVVNEAFACSRPALVTETCGTADDLVVREKTGFVYPVGEVETAAALVERLIAQPEKLREMGEHARQKVSSQYSISQFADSILEALARVKDPSP